jgi:outer membrane beta-barrel protein
MPLNPRLCLAALALPPLCALAQTPPAPPPQPIEPQVVRREVTLPRFPSRDIELSAFAGSYSTQNFGTGNVSGVKLGYHITEDFFVLATAGQTTVSDANFRRVLPGGLFANPEQKLEYANVAAGWNVLPGEVFFWGRRAMPAALYLLGGIGTTKFADQRKQTLHVGFGYRVFVWNRFALSADVRQHQFALDILGRRETTRNPELSVTASVFF